MKISTKKKQEATALFQIIWEVLKQADWDEEDDEYDYDEFDGKRSIPEVLGLDKFVES